MHFFPTYPTVADRYAYLPTFGFCLATGLLLGHSVDGKPRKLVMCACMILALFWGGLSFQRVPVWQTEESLWKDVLRNYPNHVKGYTSLGAYYFQKEEYDKAFPLFKRAQELDSHSPMYDYFQGYLLYQAGDRGSALVYLDRALARNNQFLMALYDKGLIFEEMGDRDQAVSWFRRMLASTDQDPLGFYKNAARQHLQKLSAQNDRTVTP
jgi:tetratricopeptide (TPR) repeat protein